MGGGWVWFFESVQLLSSICSREYWNEICEGGQHFPSISMTFFCVCHHVSLTVTQKRGLLFEFQGSTGLNCFFSSSGVKNCSPNAMAWRNYVGTHRIALFHICSMREVEELAWGFVNDKS